jgi:1A family penicillin-binding protein
MPEKPAKIPLRKRRPRGCAGVFFVFMVIGAAFWGACLGFFVSMLDQAKTRIVGLEAFRPNVGSKIYSDPAAGGELLGEFTTDYRQLVGLNEIPLHVQKAFLATEDHLFYQHKGFRPDALAKAAIRMARSGDLHGGSTITQQVVRNVEPTGVSAERKVGRKIREILVAYQLEREYTKDEIMELYLNQVFFGGSAYGVEAAARQYFGKHCADLTLSEAATLAGLTRSPNRNRPDLYPDNARIRRDIVLQQMVDNGFIPQEACDAAKQDSVTDAVITREQRLAMFATGRGFWGPNRFLAPYFVEEVRRRVMNSNPVVVTKDELLNGGLEIYTTLDYNLQRAAEEALYKKLDEFDQDRLEALRKAGKEDEFAPVSGALVCLDNRPGREGFVRALVGGRDWNENKFNTVTQAKRQPGSSVKPFVWCAAIAEGLTASHMEVDEPFVRMDGIGRRWAPGNFDGKFMGPMTLRRSLEKSRNIVSIKLVERLGMAQVRAYMRRAGVREAAIPDHVGLTLALGTPEVTVLEQAVAFSTFARNGTYAPAQFVREVRTPDGFVSYRQEPEPEPDAIKPSVAYVVNYILQGAAQWGTGAASAPLERPRAGKTGTTNDARDAWFCGFTPDYTAVVWIGYRDNRSLGRGNNYTGGRQACPVWTDFMIHAHENLPVREFPVPEGVEFFSVNLDSGLAGGSFREAFIEGTRPPTARQVFPKADMLEELLKDDLLGSMSPLGQPPAGTSGGASVSSTELPPPPAPREATPPPATRPRGRSRAPEDGAPLELPELDASF